MCSASLIKKDLVLPPSSGICYIFSEYFSKIMHCNLHILGRMVAINSIDEFFLAYYVLQVL